MTHRVMKYRGRFACGAMTAVTLLLAVALSSCVTERYEGPEGGDGKAIKFTPAVNAPQDATRAAAGHPIESGNNIPQGGSFGVYAYSKLTPASTVDPYAPLQNAQVTLDGTDFKYSPVAKWPVLQGAELQFWAYYPWLDLGAMASVTPGDEPYVRLGNALDFTVSTFCESFVTPTDPSKQIDFMMAATPFMTGFEPVELEFHHLLTRVNFKGKVEDYALPVVINSITISGVHPDARLDDHDSGQTLPVWTLNSGDPYSAPVDMTLTTSNGLVSNTTLGPSLGWLTKPGENAETAGDMLLIPQSVQGLEVRVEASLNGVPFDNSFVYSLTGTPDWKMNQVVTYEITIAGDGMTLDAKVNGWNDNNKVGVIYDGQWWMSVDKDEVEFGPGAMIAPAGFTLKTNYPAEGVTASIPVEYSSWLTIFPLTGNLQSGYTSMIQTRSTPLSTPRTGEIHITAGNLTKVIKVVQRGYSFAAEATKWESKMAGTSTVTIMGYWPTLPVRVITGSTELDDKTVPGSVTQNASGTVDLTIPALPSGIDQRDIRIEYFFEGVWTEITTFTQYNSIAPQFARSNIVWDAANSRLTFATTQTENAMIPANSQGVLFKWGSLVAISPMGTNFGNTQGTVADPGKILFSPNGIKNYTWTQIPYVNDQTGKWANNDAAEDDFAGYDGSLNTSGPGYATTGTNANKGDICRYISAQPGWVEGNWRLPTQDEYDILIAEGFAFNGSISSGTSNEANGLWPLVFGHWLGTSATDAANHGTSTVPGVKSVYFPASGFRYDGGRVFSVGNSGLYWSASTSSSTNAYYLDNVSDNVFRNYTVRGSSFPLRCIRSN